MHLKAGTLVHTSPRHLAGEFIFRTTVHDACWGCVLVEGVDRWQTVVRHALHGSSTYCRHSVVDWPLPGA